MAPLPPAADAHGQSHCKFVLNESLIPKFHMLIKTLVAARKF